MDLINRVTNHITLERIIAVLLVAILTATMLPVINAATTSASNCYAGDNNTFPSQVISAREVDSWTNGGSTVTLYELEIYTQKPCLEKLIEIEKPYFDFLRSELGRIGEMMVQERIDYLRNLLENWDPKGKVTGISMSSPPGEGPTIASIWYSTVLYDAPGGNVKDPVNVIFVRLGWASHVADHMETNTNYKWSRTFAGSTLYALLDEDHNDWTGIVWKPQDEQLVRGSFFDKRYHIRIYDGGYDYDLHRFWSIAGAHYEEWQWLPPTHRIIEWEAAERLVYNSFVGTPFTGKIYYEYLGNRGYYQGVYNDGWAPVIELIS